MAGEVVLACYFFSNLKCLFRFRRYTPGIMILPKVKEDEEMPKARKKHHKQVNKHEQRSSLIDYSLRSQSISERSRRSMPQNKRTWY